MSEAVRALPPGTPWSVRLGRGEPARLTLVGIGFGAGFFAWWVAITLASGARLAEFSLWSENSWVEAAIRSLMLGYTITLAGIGLRTGARCMGELRAHLTGGEEGYRAAQAALANPRPSLFRATGLIGVLAMAFMSTNFDIGGWGPHRLAGLAWLGLFGWLVSRSLFVHLHVARVLSRVGGGQIDLELLDLRPLAPLVAWGLQIVLVWAIWFAIMSLFFIGPQPANPTNWLGLGPLLVMAVGALVVPVRGVHRRIRAAKRAELDRLRAAIVAERERGLASDTEAGPRLANLVAYHGLVESVQEWPFDVATWLRFGLYVAIGAGSWVGAALVERLLERALG